MTKYSLLLAAIATFFIFSSGQVSAAEDDILVEDPYVRLSRPTSKSGAVFMSLLNPSAEDDRLVSVTTDVAERAELHTHTQDANGVMQMGEVTEGFPIAGMETHILDRGGDHIMLLGLTRPLQQGDTVTLTLTFERSGDITVQVPVDNERKPGAMDHGGHSMPATN